MTLLASSLVIAGQKRLCGSALPGEVDAYFYPNVEHFVVTAALQTDGKILVGLRTNDPSLNHLLRLNHDGTRDTGFKPNVNGSVDSITVLDDGSILIGGAFTAVAFTVRNHLARLNPDGTLDTAFDVVVSGNNEHLNVNTAMLQPDGRILIGGTFTAVGGSTHGSIARLEPDGAIDRGFNPQVADGNEPGFVAAIALQSDGKILVGGVFNRVGGVPRRNVARLNPDGR